ncbi:MAG: protein translocase subunit SecD, partial [Bdellovibrionales bacterium]|nr:protein translocase subunit SecD [Bdellovibrionales bacterium]
VNRNMAIVLDQVVYSAPNIKERIGGGRAVITLGGGRDAQSQMEEAKMISTALRAGALPARLEQLEERTVGPSLGADSIAAGLRASYFSAAFVFLFMILIYRSFGFIADMALAFNSLILIAMLSALDATLTLPGICGTVLSLGMSVDANVIINERIKDELKKGATFEAAIREGYQKAFGAIFDGNVTAIATSVILFYFGTGPIRGFATTLILGLIASMFTAIFFTRVVVDTLVLKWGFKRLNIGLKEGELSGQAVRA